MDDRYGLNLYGQFAYKGVRPDYMPLDSSRCWVFPPNWASPVSVEYTFRTVLQRTQYAIEQRRPQLPVPKRTMRYSVMCQAEELPELVSFIERLSDVLMWWPLWVEPVRLSDIGSLIGLTTLIPAASTALLYNLRSLSDFVMLMHRTDYAPVEVLQLTAAADLSLTLDAAVTVALSGEDAVIFPAVRGYVSQWQVRNETEAVATVDVTLNEVIRSEQD